MTPEILAPICDALAEVLNANGNYQRIRFLNKDGISEEFLSNHQTREVLCVFLGKIKKEKSVFVECNKDVMASWTRNKKRQIYILKDSENANKITLKYKGPPIDD